MYNVTIKVLIDTAIRLPLQLVGELCEKLEHSTAQFADRSVECNIKGKSIQYELFEHAIESQSV